MTVPDFSRPAAESGAITRLRLEVRDFLADHLRETPLSDKVRSWSRFDADFSREVGRRGWLGMTWPKRYGGGERSALERFVVIEEMLAAGAPVAAHWFADRQSGPALLKYGTEEQRRTLLPKMAAGECYFCIGMSEPDAGSDLAAVRTKAVAVDGGFRINGTKVWTTYAHKAHFMILFCRTGEANGRQKGTSQLLVDMSTPGVTVRPILNLGGEQEFNEVVFEDAFVPASCLIGELGEGWRQVTSELAFERSGPERFLSSFPLLEALGSLIAEVGAGTGVEIGRFVAHLAALRQLSRSVAAMLQAGEAPQVQAALVKDLGAEFEQEIIEVAQRLSRVEPDPRGSEFAAALAQALFLAPVYSLRGGTREILRGIIARGLGLR